MHAPPIHSRILQDAEQDGVGTAGSKARSPVPPDLHTTPYDLYLLIYLGGNNPKCLTGPMLTPTRTKHHGPSFMVGFKPCQLMSPLAGHRYVCGAHLPSQVFPGSFGGRKKQPTEGGVYRSYIHTYILNVELPERHAPSFYVWLLVSSAGGGINIERKSNSVLQPA